MAGRISTVFFWCNSVKEVRAFYSGVLGLAESFGDDAQGVAYDLSGAGEAQQFFFLPGPEPLPVQREWAMSPSFSGDKIAIPSWVVEVAPADFDTVVARAQASEVTFHPDGESGWDGHRQIYLKDPMGNTVELYAPPAEA